MKQTPTAAAATAVVSASAAGAAGAAAAAAHSADVLAARTRSSNFMLPAAVLQRFSHGARGNAEQQPQPSRASRLLPTEE